MGALEAKKEGFALTGIEPQVKSYSDGLPTELTAPHRPLPFLYLSTGVETCHRPETKGVSGSDLKRMPLPLPPGAEQSRIEAEANRRLSVAEECRLESDRAIARGARLRQSILKWAFEGKLVDQDPNDEPASVLLDRIPGRARTASPDAGAAVAQAESANAIGPQGHLPYNVLGEPR